MPLENIIEFLELHRQSRIALVGHQRPDGDAVGSCLGLARSLRSNGFNAELVNVAPIPSNLSFLASDIIVRHEAPDWHKNYDCLGVLDCGEEKRVDEINREALKALPTFNIDHHVSNDGVGQAIWIDPNASSTGEMVVRLCRRAGWPLPRDAAQALWTAIVTDTGRFSFENTSVDAMYAATECLAAGASPQEVAAHVYQSITLEERRLQSLVLSRMTFYEDGKLAVSWLRHQDFIDARIGVKDVQDLINLLRDTSGVVVALFLYELEADVRVSMRTASPYDAIEVVKQFGGGGHIRAAGCTLPAPVEEAMAAAISAVKKAYFP